MTNQIESLDVSNNIKSKRQTTIDDYISKLHEDGNTHMETACEQIAGELVIDMTDDGLLKTEREMAYARRKLYVLFYNWSSARGTFDEEVEF